MKVDEESAAVLMVNTVKGLYRVARLPFGISAAPAILQRMMENALAGIPGIRVHLDDIIFNGKDMPEHAERADQVLPRLSRARLQLKREKCQFGVESVQFLRHKINGKGVHTTEQKVQAIVKVSRPTDKTPSVSWDSCALRPFFERQSDSGC